MSPPPMHSNKMRGARHRGLALDLGARRPGLSPPPPLKTEFAFLRARLCLTLLGDADLARLNDHETAGKFVRLFPDDLQYRSRERASCLARKPDENHAGRGGVAGKH